MSNTVFKKFFEKINRDSISTTWTLIPGIQVDTNSRFPLLFPSQINSSTEPESSTGVMFMKCHWLYNITFNHPFCKMELQIGLDKSLIQHQIKSYFFLHIWFANLSLTILSEKLKKINKLEKLLKVNQRLSVSTTEDKFRLGIWVKDNVDFDISVPRLMFYPKSKYFIRWISYLFEKGDWNFEYINQLCELMV